MYLSFFLVYKDDGFGYLATVRELTQKSTVFRKGIFISNFHDMGNLQRLPITRDLSPSKESDKVAFWWTSIKEKPLKLF